MHKWLHRHDLSYKKPKGFPHKANPQSQEFITEYEKLNDNFEILKSSHLQVYWVYHQGWWLSFAAVVSLELGEKKENFETSGASSFTNAFVFCICSAR